MALKNLLKKTNDNCVKSFSQGSTTESLKMLSSADQLDHDSFPSPPVQFSQRGKPRLEINYRPGHTPVQVGLRRSILYFLLPHCNSIIVLWSRPDSNSSELTWLRGKHRFNSQPM